MKTKNKLISFLLAMFLICSSYPSYAAVSGDNISPETRLECGDAVTASVKGVSKDTQLIVALYDVADNTLHSVDTVKISDISIDEYTASLTVPYDDKSYIAKVFVWDKELTPVSGETQAKLHNRMFVNSNGRYGINDKLVMYTVKDSETGEYSTPKWKAVNSDGLECICFSKENNSKIGTYAELTPGNLYTGISSYVFQTDIYIADNETSEIYIRKESKLTPPLSPFFNIDKQGKLFVQKEEIGVISSGEWVNLAIAVDLENNICDAYVNRRLIKKSIPVSGNAYPDKIRMGLISGRTGKAEVYLNKIKMYDGMVLRDFPDTDNSSIGVKEYLFNILKTVSENESDFSATDLLENDVVFMTSNDKFFAHGKKQDYKSYGSPAYIADGKLMVDKDVFTYATGIELPDNAGTSFVDAAAVAKENGMYVYEGDNRGFIVISEESKEYSNNILSHHNQEDIDIIWRYMQFDRPSPDELYSILKNSNMYKSHPRLLIKANEIDALKKRVNEDADLKNAYDKLLSDCETHLAKDPQKRVYNTGKNIIFSACYNVKIRLFDLCTAYLLTGDEKYALRAWQEMENALNWEDWNTDVHFLDSGEIAPGMAFAYDVLYNYLDSSQKKIFRDKIQKQYLDFCVGVYSGQSNYDANDYRHIDCNWGAVTGAAMYMTALTLVDEEGEESPLTHKCKYIMANSMQTFEHIVTALAPEGTWHEGAGYYEYVQQHLAWLLEATDNVFNMDFGFLDAKGVKELTRFIMYTQTNIGDYNYGSVTGLEKRFAPEAFIYAYLTDDADGMKLYNDFRKSINVQTFIPQYILFYNPDFASDSIENELPLDCHYETMGVSSIRKSWTDIKGLYLGVRSSANTGSSHRDKGSFIFETGGVRWSVDMGRNDNNTMDYLLRTESHSALVINPTADHMGQSDGGEVPLVARGSSKTDAYLIYNMKDAYRDWVDSYKRGFYVSDNRQTLTVRDELTLKEESQLLWNFVTKAEITISADGKSAILTQNGKTLNVTAICSLANWQFKVIDSLEPTGGWITDSYGYTPSQQQSFSKGVKRLVLEAEGSGNVNIAVKLAPAGIDCTPLNDISLNNWVIDN